MQYSIEPNERITFGIAYEDESMAIVEKPAGVVTLPGRGHADDSLLNGLFARYGDRLQQLGKARDYGLLHRLDKETSGLVCVAMSANVYDHLRAQFAGRKVRKFYYAVTARAPEPAEGVIRLAIAESRLSEAADASSVTAHRGKIRPKTAHVARVGKPAVTAYRTLDVSAHAALIEARPITGRLHQVRVHLDAIGCPILGDAFYGPRRAREAWRRLALHAHRLVIEHPVSGEAIDARAELPKDLRRLCRTMGLRAPGGGGGAGGAMGRAVVDDDIHDGVNDVGELGPGGDGAS